MKSLNRPMFRMGGQVINKPKIGIGYNMGGPVRQGYMNGLGVQPMMQQPMIQQPMMQQPMNSNGIVSGFNQGGSVRQGYNTLSSVGVVDDPYYQLMVANQEKAGEDLDARLAMMREENVAPDGFSDSDWLRVAQAGFNIMGAPNEGSGFKGALKSAAPAGAKFFEDTASAFDTREAAYRTREQGIDEIELGMDASKFKIASEAASNYALQKIDLDEFERMQASVQKEQEYIINLDPNTKDFDILIKQAKNRIGLALAGRLSPILSGMSDDERESYMDQAKQAIATKYALLVESLDGKQLAEAQSYYNTVVYKAALAQLGIGLGYLDPAPVTKRPNSADGGRVGMYMGGDPGIPNANPTPGFEPGSGPVQDPNQPPIMTAQTGQADPNKLTFQELRARLPLEVSDQVVRLLAASEEALMVFAQIETQQDVSNFNQRFQADLKLPEQVA